MADASLLEKLGNSIKDIAARKLLVPLESFLCVGTVCSGGYKAYRMSDAFMSESPFL